MIEKKTSVLHWVIVGAVFLFCAQLYAYEIQTGNCEESAQYTHQKYTNARYQCWYGTDDMDTMILFEDGVGIQPRDQAYGIFNLSEGFFIPTKMQVLFGLGGDDEIRVFEKSLKIGYLHGGEGNDELHGGRLSDHLFGGPGNDFLYAKQGNDELDGGPGNDLMSGFTGFDTFYISSPRDRLDNEFGEKVLEGPSN